MRTALELLALLIAINAEGVYAQNAAAQPSTADTGTARTAGEDADEIVVRGRRLSELRFEVQTARERAYEIFNAINSNDEFDIYCRDERKYHSRTTRRVCRARFESNIGGRAATEYMMALFRLCPPDPQTGAVLMTDCMFGDRSGSARSVAGAVAAEAEPKRAALNEEIWRLAREDDGFAQAILDYFESQQQYEAARDRRRDD